jgi:hypothetical protein
MEIQGKTKSPFIFSQLYSAADISIFQCILKAPIHDTAHIGPLA